MTEAPAMLALEGVSKRFVKRLDLAARIANLLGAGLRDEVVHAEVVSELPGWKIYWEVWTYLRPLATWPASGTV